MNPIFPLPITHYPLPITHYPLANKPSCRLSNSTIQQFNNLLSLALSTLYPPISNHQSLFTIKPIFP